MHATIKPTLLAATLVSVTLMAMAGACSQHEPGDYQGGNVGSGRTIPTAVIGPAAGGVVTADSGGVDVYIPDVAVPEDVEIPETTIPD